jgi:hypothetical protein
MFPLACSFLLLPSPPIPTCFRHCRLFKYLICFYLFRHILACLVVCMFDLWACPPCLVLLSPFCLCRRWNIRGTITTSNLVIF